MIILEVVDGCKRFTVGIDKIKETKLPPRALSSDAGIPLCIK